MLMAEIITPDYRFESADDCLRFAFGIEAQRVSPDGFMTEHTGRSSGMTPFELIAEGMRYRAACLDSVGVRGKDVLIAYYTVPNDGSLIVKKNTAIEKLGQWLYSENHRDRWCQVDGVRQWLENRHIHDHVWWARHFNKSPKTIWGWWNSKKPEDKSVTHFMNLWYSSSLDKVGSMLRDNEVIP